MSKASHDINDDEIRIISSENKADESRLTTQSGRHRFIVILSVAIGLLLLIGLLYVVLRPAASEDNDDELVLVTNNDAVIENNTHQISSDTIASEPTMKGHVVMSDTIVNRVPLSIFKPVNSTPSLHIGTDVLNDSNMVLVVQAADVRRDNGGIVGAYVKEGELISKGQAKSGFCAIIGGKLTIGVADATPFLEQALETDGYFFRQYPLVVANQIVENKPKGESLRKALAELNGQTVVVMSKEKMTFRDFSQSLVDLGVTNAIYLVGGKGYGFAMGRAGEKVEFGLKLRKMPPNTNYIVWR